MADGMIPPDVNPTELAIIGDIIADHQRRQTRFGHQDRAAYLHALIEERGGAVQLGGGIRIVVAPESAPAPPPRVLLARERERLLRSVWGR